MIKCEQCGVEVDSEDVCEHSGRALCEDCYIDAMMPAKACDPWAVRMATAAGKLEGAGEMTELQGRIVKLLEEKGEMSVDDIPAALGVSDDEVQRGFATLHHMDKLCGNLSDGKIYVRLKDE